MNAYGKLEQAAAKLHRLPERLRNLAELKAATLTSCAYCIDFGSLVARRSGLTDEQLLALPAYRTSALFTDLEKLVLDYAVGMSRTPAEVPDSLFAALGGVQRRHGVCRARDRRPPYEGERVALGVPSFLIEPPLLKSDAAVPHTMQGVPTRR